MEEIRLLLSEAVLDSKFDDSFITRTVLGRALSTLVTRTFGISSANMYIRMSLDLVEDQEYYVLPPQVLQLARVAKFHDDGTLQWDWRPRGDFNPAGPGWVMEGNSLRFNPLPTEDDTIEVWYVPSGWMNLHYSSNGGTASAASDAETFTLAASPTIGLLGRSEQEYRGQILRVLDANVHAERIISDYNATTRVATLRSPLPTLSSASSLAYEVVPAGMGPFWGAAASLGAMTLGTGRRITGTHMQNIANQHRQDLKTLRDVLAAMQGRVPPHVDRNTIDNPEYQNVWDRS